MAKTILYVDDDPDDRDILLEIVNDLNPNVNVEFAGNGEEALDYLNEKKRTSNTPCLIILDLNMPVLGGKETFEKIKEDEELESVPIIIFTSSRNPQDKALFNSLGIEYVTKPHEYSMMNKIVRDMINRCRP